MFYKNNVLSLLVGTKVYYCLLSMYRFDNKKEILVLNMNIHR